MTFQCAVVDADYFESAPMSFRYEVTINAPAEKVFAVFEDGESWPQWFDGITGVEWTSPKPYGVGTTRSVHLGPLTVHEYFFRWQQNVGFSFYFSGTNLPFVKALAEDYQLEQIGENQTRFVYQVACEPILPIRLLGPIGKFLLNRKFKKAAQALPHYVETLP